jgi:hypothetical protein
MRNDTQIKSNSKEMISENKKLSICENRESNIPLSLKDKIEMWEEKGMLDKLVDEIDAASDSLIQG